MGKVRFGLSNAHYSIYDAKTKKYDTPVAIKGSVSLSLTASGSDSDFWADNVKYASFSTNGGYDGTFEIAAAEDQQLEDLLGFVNDNGLILETTDAKTVEFALMFEVTGNEVDQRTVLYNCTLSRPGVNANTKSDQTNPDTQSFSFKAIGRDLTFKGETRNVVKGSVENTTENKTKYDGFMTSVLLPTEEAA